jgi:hypothetical protein
VKIVALAIVTGIMAVTSLATAQPQISGEILIDANRREMGKIVDLPYGPDSGSVTVAMEKGNAKWTMECNRYNCETEDNIYFSELNCTGEMGIFKSPSGHRSDIYHTAAVAPPNRTIYVSKRDPQKLPRTMVSKSVWVEYDGSCSNHRQPITDSFAYVFVAGSLNVFTPEFHPATASEIKAGILPSPLK